MKIGCDIKVQKIYPSGKKKQIKKKIKLKMDTSPKNTWWQLILGSKCNSKYTNFSHKVLKMYFILLYLLQD